MATQELQLFAPENGNDPWSVLAQEIDQSPIRATLVAYWKQAYDAWKKLYRHFRETEHKSFYAGTANNAPPQPNEGMLRKHRIAISSLMEKGEQLASLLDSVASVSTTKEEKDEAVECKMKIGNLLESLRESLVLWHPANKPSPESFAKLKGLFA